MGASPAWKLALAPPSIVASVLWNMASFLFLTWNGAGATVPVIAIGRELQARGHEVRVLGHAAQSEAFAQAGLLFSPYRRAGAFEVGASPAKLLALMASRDAARDVADELAARRVDLVVGDLILLSTLTAVRASGQRYALLESTADSLMRGRMSKVGAVMRLMGLPVKGILRDASGVVVASAAELDPAGGPDAAYVGAMTPASAAAPTEPTLLISLSTFGFPALRSTWQRLLDVVGEADVTVIGTTGPALDPAALTAGENTTLLAWSDHSEIMRTVSAAVTHGGHGTTIAALAHGLPVLVVPLDHTSDQPGIGKLVEQAGVGITVPRSASPERMRTAIERVLCEERLRANAQALGGRIRAYGGAAAGADALLALT